MKRISGYISDELYAEIEDIAKRENRKVTPMISILLQQSVKEKKRKRKSNEKSGTTEEVGNKA